MLLRLSKLAGALSDGSTASVLPGLAPDPEMGASSLQKEPVFNGTEGRLFRAQGVGLKMKDPQGPRAYAPRLSKP